MNTMNTTQMILTAHSVQRAKERLGIRSADKLMRRACNAWERGLTAEHAETVWQQKYMQDKEKGNKEIRIYSGTVFVFGVMNGTQTLITLFPVPKYAAGNTMHSSQKRNKRFYQDLLN